MEYLQSGSSSSSSSELDSKKMHDPAVDVDSSSKEEDELFDSTIRRTRGDSDFTYYFLQALTSGDDEYISRIFGGLRTDYPRLSQLIQQEVAKREARLAYKPKSRFSGISFYLPWEHEAIAKARRDGRKSDAETFRQEYYYGSGLDQKTLVWPSTTYQWTDKSSGGVTWLGVHGIDSICVVTRARDLDVRRVHRYLKYRTVEQVLSYFRKTVISEIEDLASMSSKLCERFGESISKPFGVVSLVLGTDDDHEGSGLMYISDEDEEYEKLRKKRLEYMPKVPGYDEKKTIKYLREHMRKDATRTNNEVVKASSTEYHKSKAIEFLQEKMKTMNKEAFTVDETIKTAISAFQHLFRKEFKANDIGVCVMDPKYFVKPGEHTFKDIYVKHLEMNEIESHLTAINQLAGSEAINELAGSKAINELAGSEASFERMIPPSLPTYLPPSLPILG